MFCVSRRVIALSVFLYTSRVPHGIFFPSPFAAPLPGVATVLGEEGKPESPSDPEFSVRSVILGHLQQVRLCLSVCVLCVCCVWYVVCCVPISPSFVSLSHASVFVCTLIATSPLLCVPFVPPSVCLRAEVRPRLIACAGADWQRDACSFCCST